MLIIPIQAVPTQQLNVSVNQQAVSLNLYATGVDQSIYVDIYLSGALVIGGVFGLIGTRLIRDSYLGFSGDFLFNDTAPDPVLGPENPRYEGLGSRWQLLYLYPAELSGDC